jgi:ZIP family zinc transporter
MWTALVVATLTGLATGLGVIPFFFRQTIPRRIYDAVLGMGAGLMLSAATLGLMASALEHVRPHGGEVDVAVLVEIIIGFVVGVILLVLMDRVIPHLHARGHREHISHPPVDHHVGDAFHPHEHEHHEQVRHGLLISGAMTIHRLPEGFAIGAGFASGNGHTLGWMLAVAVAFQNVCEGAVMGAPLRLAGWSRAKSFLIVLATGLAVPFAAIVGYLATSHIAGALPFALALASGALIYLISNEIIPETHSHGNEALATMGLVLGFLVTILVRSVGHTH